MKPVKPVFTGKQGIRPVKPGLVNEQDLFGITIVQFEIENPKFVKISRVVWQRKCLLT